MNLYKVEIRESLRSVETYDEQNDYMETWKKFPNYISASSLQEALKKIPKEIKSIIVESVQLIHENVKIVQGE